MEQSVPHGDPPPLSMFPNAEHVSPMHNILFHSPTEIKFPHKSLPDAEPLCSRPQFQPPPPTTSFPIRAAPFQFEHHVPQKRNTHNAEKVFQSQMSCSITLFLPLGTCPMRNLFVQGRTARAQHTKHPLRSGRGSRVVQQNHTYCIGKALFVITKFGCREEFISCGTMHSWKTMVGIFLRDGPVCANTEHFQGSQPLLPHLCPLSVP